MTEAITCRLRLHAGTWRLSLAPAGGMGLSFPCCNDGHPDQTAAMDCGTQLLRQRLLTESAAPLSA